ncbi:MAG: PAS domain-containing protein, partial [Gemmataceae bacterium]
MTTAAGGVTFACARLNAAFPVISIDPPLQAVPAGVCVLLGLLFGWRAAFGAVLGAGLAAGRSGWPAADTGLVMFATGVQTAAAAAARRFAPAPGGTRTTDFVALLALGTALAVVRGLVTIAGWWVLDKPDPATAGAVAAGLEWTTLATIGPAVFVWQRLPSLQSVGRWVEFAGTLFLTAVSCQFAFGGHAPATLDLHPPLLIWFLVLFAWASFRFYLHGSAAVAAVLYTVVYANAVGRGGFAGLMPAGLTPTLQTELLVVLGLLTALQHLLAAVSSDRTGGAGEVARLHDELKAQHAALERQERDGAARRAFLEAVLAQLPAGVMIAGPDGRILVRNDRHRRMFSQEPSRLSDLPQGRMSTTQTTRLPFDRWPIVGALRDGKTTEGFSARVQLDDGQSIDANVCAAPVRGPAGELLGAVSVMTDVTERNKVVRELRANEQKLRVALQAAHMIVLEWRAADGRLARPEALADWLGLPPDAPLRAIADVLPHVHPDHADPLAEKIAGLMAGVPRCETVFRLKDCGAGRPEWVLSRSLALVDDAGQPTGVITSVLVDVTERYRQIDQLRLLESAVVHARDAVIILENKSQAGGGRSVLYANAAFAQMSGYEPAEVVGRSL